MIPIVAKSKILSWHTGRFCDGNINSIRELCIGTKLFGLNAYWKSVSDKLSGFFVILLTDEEWLEKPIFFLLALMAIHGYILITLKRPKLVGPRSRQRNQGPTIRWPRSA